MPVNEVAVVSPGRDLTVVALSLRVFSTGVIVEIDLLALLDANDGLRVGAAERHQAEAHRLHRAGGGSYRFTVAWWVSPLPDAGTLRFAVRWARSGIPTPVTLTVPVPAVTEPTGARPAEA